MVNDPVADMLTRIRNGDGEARLCADSVVPGQAVHRQDTEKRGFIADYEVLKGKPERMIKVYLRYIERGTGH